MICRMVSAWLGGDVMGTDAICRHGQKELPAEENLEGMTIIMPI